MIKTANKARLISFSYKIKIASSEPAESKIKAMAVDSLTKTPTGDSKTKTSPAISIGMVATNNIKKNRNTLF